MVNHNISSLIQNYTFPVKLALPGAEILPGSKSYPDEAALGRINLPKFIHHIHQSVVVPAMKHFQYSIIGDNIDKQMEFHVAKEKQKLKMVDEYIQRYCFYENCLKDEAYCERLPIEFEQATFADIMTVGIVPDIAEDMRKTIVFTLESYGFDWIAALNPQLKNVDKDNLCLSKDGRMLIPSDATKGFAVYAVECIAADVEETICALGFRGSAAEVLEQRRPFKAQIKHEPASRARRFNRYIDYKAFTPNSFSS